MSFETPSKAIDAFNESLATSRDRGCDRDNGDDRIEWLPERDKWKGPGN